MAILVVLGFAFFVLVACAILMLTPNNGSKPMPKAEFDRQVYAYNRSSQINQRLAAKYNAEAEKLEKGGE